MKKHQMNVICFIFFAAMLLTACGTPALPQTARPVFTATSAVTPTVESTTIPTETVVPTQTDTPTLAFTETAAPTLTATITPTAEKTETIGEQLKSHIVFYLIVPEKNRRDACGDITVEPIISKRLRTGDKLQDVQIALNMLFGIGAKYYGVYYNAMWDTDFTIENYQYNAKKDYMTIEFGGYFPYTKLTSCDKHGIREQIWATFFHYKFREKTFKVAGGFLIDRLGGD